MEPLRSPPGPQPSRKRLRATRDFPSLDLSRIDGVRDFKAMARICDSAFHSVREHTAKHLPALPDLGGLVPAGAFIELQGHSG
jgi:hypothetical protein